MNLLSSNKDKWRRKVLASNAWDYYDAGNVAGFPYETLKRATIEFIASRRGLPAQSPECDVKLTELITDFVGREGPREIAILACVNGLTPHMAAALLTSLRDGPPDALASLNYLKCLSFAGRASPSLVPVYEIKAAECLALLLARHENPGQLFQNLIMNLGLLSYNYFLPAGYVGQTLNFTRFCSQFEKDLENMRKSRSFMRLYNDVSWLRGVPDLTYPTLPIAVLNALLPSWQLWATWNPNYLRLMAWEGGQLTPTQKQRLGNILDLEGPDTAQTGHAALKESVPACFNHILVSRRDPALPHRLLDLLDKAQAVEGTYAVDLFIHLCVSNAADEGDMELAKSIIRTGDDDCCRHTLLVLRAIAPNAGINDRIVALTNGLPGIQSYAILRDRFADLVVTQVVSAVGDAQEEYCQQLHTRGTAENFGLKLLAFGKAVLATAWVQPRLPPSFVQTLRAFPAEELVKDMFDHLKAAPASIEAVKAYLGATLGGQGGETEALLAAVQARMRLYGTGPPNSDHVAIALAIERLPCVDAALAGRCQDQLAGGGEEQILVQDLRRAVEMEPNALCNELARVLARRRELSFAIGDCWAVLLRRVMAQQARGLIEWSAEKLAPAEWFRWLKDLDILFSTGAVGRYDGREIGLTPQLRAWWDDLLGIHSRAVYRIEALQRGQGSLRWLYLDEIEHADVLLDLLTYEEKITYLHSAILTYFEADREVIAYICMLLAWLAELSPLARRCIETLLDRHRIAAADHAWSLAALRVMHLGWERRLRTSPRKDRAALAVLQRLVQTEPDTDQAGFTDAAGRLTAEYGQVLKRAAEVESTRLTLRLHSPQRTATFLARLGIQDSRGGIADPSIPESLSDSIEALDDGAYELAFPLTQLRGYQRQTWGFPDEATMLLVRISLLDTDRPSFCIHFYPNWEGPRTHTGMFRVGGTENHMPDGKFCSTPPSPFTYLLGRSLAKYMAAGKHKPRPSQRYNSVFGHSRSASSVSGRGGLQSLHELVAETLATPGAKCMACVRSLPAKVWRPAPCLRGACETELRRAPLESLAVSLLADPPVLDFLLACVFAAAQDTSGLDLLPQCPIAKASLPDVINSFPPLRTDADITAAKLLAGIRSGVMAAERERLLSWICLSFGGFMLSAPAGSRVPLMPGAHQFLMASSPADREQAFSLKQTSGVGGVAFHGTASNRLWLVLTQGLKNMSGTPFMIHGQSAGPGIYLADEPAHALGYGGGLGATWSGSAFSHNSVLLGCELQGHSPANYHVIPDEDRVLVRYVFLCPANFAAPQARLIETAMKSTFASLRTGSF